MNRIFKAGTKPALDNIPSSLSLGRNDMAVDAFNTTIYTHIARNPNI
jgi:hypothetical protein